jgi:hypothetical protein
MYNPHVQFVDEWLERLTSNIEVSGSSLLDFEGLFLSS